MKTGNSLKVCLAVSKIRQKDLAVKVNVKPVQMSHWVASGSISDENVARICTAFGIKQSEFLAFGEMDIKFFSR